MSREDLTYSGGPLRVRYVRICIELEHNRRFPILFILLAGQNGYVRRGFPQWVFRSIVTTDSGLS